MFIGDLEIGNGNPPRIIAEIGINHNGSLEEAKHLVKLAVSAGADIIKHQTHIVEDEMTAEAKNVFPPNDSRSIWQIMADCSLSMEDEINLKKYTESLGAIYISTPFSRRAANFLDEINVPAFKIGSGELSNTPLLRHIASFGKPIILSTGMHSLQEVSNAVKILEMAKVEFCLLECTNLYPSPPENVSLRGITELKKQFPKIPIGFSDHSIGPYMAIASVGLGAVIIERHFTDTKYREGPDIVCSMDPAELLLLKEQSKQVFIASTNKKERTKDEEKVFKFARSSIVADRDIAAGLVISEHDIWARRPGTGPIPGTSFDDLVGKKATRYIKRGEFIKWNDVE